jgi:hypothetical protein
MQSELLEQFKLFDWAECRLRVHLTQPLNPQKEK